MKKGVLIVNVGTPDSPSVKDVRRYLREFLMDRRVIDIPVVSRFLLVQLTIAPFRAPQSARAYQELWTKEGSPLKTYGYQVERLLQKSLGDDYCVVLGMRYQSPSMRSALEQLKERNVDEVVVIPLYPQYASASSGSTIEKVMDELKKWEVIPPVRFVNQFFENPIFIEAFVKLGQQYMRTTSYDHFVFSYHGLPERQIQKASCDGYCTSHDTCCFVYHSKNQYCYRAQCFETTRLLAAGLGLSKEHYTVCFQSRLGRDPWIKPYTDEVIVNLAARGIKRVLCFSPSFIADCLETTIEIGVEYKEAFKKNGGARWDLVRSLNAYSVWIECLKDLVLDPSMETLHID